MADKKEILDYLRNRQKAAEIDAKVNGINLWVLLGALAIVSWQLAGFADSSIWNEREPILRTLFAAEAGYIAAWMCASRIRQVDHIRFSSWRITDMDTPFLDIVQGVLFIAPLALLLHETGDWTVVVIGVFGLISVISGAAAILRLFRGENPESKKFPEPDFAATPRSSVILSSLFFLVSVWILVYQILLIDRLLPKPSAESAKILGTLAVFYILCFLSLRRRAFGESTRWTYELETDLLLDVVSTDVARRRIEHRALGPRLQDVMDKFFDSLDRSFVELDNLRADCMAKLAVVAEVPSEYEVERVSRARAATEPMDQVLQQIKQECDELLIYLNRLEERIKVASNSSFRAQVSALRLRHTAYLKKQEDVRAAIRTAMPPKKN